MEVLQKKNLGILLDSDRSMSHYRDTVEGKYHTGIHNQELTLARYMKSALFTQHG